MEALGGRALSRLMRRSCLDGSSGTAGKHNDPERFALLTRRHRECLRGVKALKGSKEIAIELGLGKSTVDSYLAEAVRLLGARNRRDAAIALAEHEALEGIPSSGQVPEIEENTTPIKSYPILRGWFSNRPPCQ
ncbi:helix-turn-helix transcriptional regulator [Sphingomonas sp. I4]